jgi:ABC-type tungstate transport system permease subunit
MVIADYSTDQHSVSCRVRLVAARRATAAADVRAAITTALYNTGLVQSILVEGEGGTSAPQLPAIPVVTNVAMAAR